MVLIVCACQTMHAWPHRKSPWLRVRFLAEETLVRGTWGINQDKYLAEFIPSGNCPSGILQIVDEYSEWDFPISFSDLSNKNGIKLRLQRDMSCDVMFSNLNLRAAPGDPEAILAVTMTYKPNNLKDISQNQTVPCYHIVRKWKENAK